MLIESYDSLIPIEEVPIETVYDSKTDHVTHFDPIKDSIRIYKIFGAIFLNYIFSSFSASVIDLIAFTILCGAFKNTGSVYYILLATCVARVLSATYNFMVNYYIVFKSKEVRSKSAMRYVMLAIAQMLLSAALVTAGVHLFEINETIVKMVIDGILFFVSYSVQKRFVY